LLSRLRTNHADIEIEYVVSGVNTDVLADQEIYRGLVTTQPPIVVISVIPNGPRVRTPRQVKTACGGFVRVAKNASGGTRVTQAFWKQLVTFSAGNVI